MSNRRILGTGELGRRLALAFVLVALLSIAVLFGFSEATIGPDITRLIGRQETTLTRSIAMGAAATYGQAGWRSSNVEPVLELARTADASAQVRDMTGGIVNSSPGFATLHHGPVLREPVIVRDRQVGQVIVKFNEHDLGVAVARFEATRRRALIIAASMAALLALLVSVAVARLITSPLEAMLDAIRARGAGDRHARVSRVRGVGVQRELQEAFNWSMDALDKRDRLRRNLVADVAHELRTPVAVLQASHEAMLDGVTDPTRQNLESLREEVLRLARMVEDLQRLAAAESAALQLTLVPCDLSAVTAEAASPLRESFSAAGVGLTERLAEVQVMCDPGRMREVVSNLLTNALKFTPPGGSVVLDTGPDETGMARIGVRDTGTGIPRDELPHVTERFFRGLHSPQMAAGTGIGLTIVAELVQAHRGQLDIASAPGRGTQVTITLPLAAAESRRLALLQSDADRSS
ncbi:MAG TPA: ATP-binding protein [Streptosporangiaceae bacterium]|nr:ATP-binding protein [Streptosporangiaceae bacterium]